MFKVGDVVSVVSTKEELGGNGIRWTDFSSGRHMFLGKTARIRYIHGTRYYLCIDQCYFGWEAHQLRKVV